MKSIGKLIYSPKTHLASSKDWAILSCDDEFSKYYRHLYELNNKALNSSYCGKLVRPVWGAHISCIRNEKITTNNWGISANKTFEFEYEPGVSDNKEYFWLNVKCPAISEIRLKYNLSPFPKFGFHLTIGRKAC